MDIKNSFPLFPSSFSSTDHTVDDLACSNSKPLFSHFPRYLSVPMSSVRNCRIISEIFSSLFSPNGLSSSSVFQRFVLLSWTVNSCSSPNYLSEDPQPDLRVTAVLSFILGAKCGGYSTPRPGCFNPGTEILYPFVGGCVGHMVGLDGCGKSRPPTRIRSPGLPACSDSLYRLSYCGPYHSIVSPQKFLFVFKILLIY